MTYENLSGIRNVAREVFFPTYSRYEPVFLKGKGVYLYDMENRRYLDFLAGIAVCNLGHVHHSITEAVSRQIERLWHTSNLFYTVPQIEVAELLIKNSFAKGVFFCNSGAEANEAAIKLARKYALEKFGPDRYEIICAEASFHGRTMATLSATGQSKVQKGFKPLLPGFKFVPYNDISAILKVITSKTCAILLEPIQGEGGVNIPTDDYLKEVRKICDDNNILLILDEVQTGMGRTGYLFAHQYYDIEPDIMTLAKALANGLPIGAMLAKETLKDTFGPGSHASTFGGNPICCAAAKASLEIISSAEFLQEVRKKGTLMENLLKELKEKYPFIKTIRGRGLIWGIELENPCGDMVKDAMKKGLIINVVQERVIRLLPPLIISEEEIKEGIEILSDIFKENS